MGLDMFLYAKISMIDYDKNYVFDSVTLRDTKDNIIQKHIFNSIECPASSITMECGYWRKANAIHNYMMNLSDGESDGSDPIYISYEQLCTLKKICLTIKNEKDPDKQRKYIEENLPPTDGFFFGNTDYKTPQGLKWYIESNIDTTLEILKTINKIFLAFGTNCEFRYEASW